MLRLLTIISALFLASAAAASTLWVEAPRDGYLNLRSGPSTEYQVISQTPHGSKVKVLKTPGKWYKVRHASGAVGWAHSRFLTADRPKGYDRDGGYAGQFAPVPNGHTGGKHGGKHGGQDYWVYAPGYKGLNLRHGPGTQFPVILTMQQRDRATELDRYGKWILLRHGSGQIGWAHGDYLVKQDPGYIQGHKGGHGNTTWDHGKKKGGNKGGHKGNKKADLFAQAVQICSQRPPRKFERCMIRKLGLMDPHPNW
jgi:uncharacterized protein YraI